MFRPNTTCTISSANGQTDVYGSPLVSVTLIEGCSIAKMVIDEKRSSLRADTSASRGNAREIESNTVILLTKSTQAQIDDYIAVAGNQFRIMSMSPKHDIIGNLDHYEASCEYWMG